MKIKKILPPEAIAEKREKCKEKSFFLKKIFIKRKSLVVFNKLLNNQFLSSKELSEINWKKRKEIVLYAYNHCEFYKKFYDENNFHPKDLNVPEDFEKIPIVTKKDIRDNFDGLIASGVDSKYRRVATTGGSTGEPLKVLHDLRVQIETFGWRTLSWWNIHPWDNIAFIYRVRRTGLKKFLSDIFWWPMKRIFLDASFMTKDSMLKFVKEYKKIKPTVIQGYVGGVFEFAKFIDDNNIFLIPPKAVWVTSAPLSESQRLFMEKVFNAPVFDQYGSCEVHWIAAECCKQKGLHVFTDVRHIEFVDENGSNIKNEEYGDVLITDLENRVFPLIRYKIGDKGRMLKRNCSCGLNFPLMDKIKGRISDIIIMPNGDVISGEFLTTIFDDFPTAVEIFQIRQFQDYSLEIKCVPSKDIKLFEKVSEIVIENLKKKTNNSIKININIVSEISHDKGKTRFIVSDLSSR